MSAIFDAAVAFTLRHEGGHANDPHDPGGETNWGISKRSYPTLDIAALTREEAIALYLRDYWTPVRGDELPGTVALLVFEAAVNQGVETAIRLLQETLAHGVEVDGDLGPQTMTAIHSTNHDDLALRYAARRAWRYEINPRESRYGLGWFTRLLDAYRTALVHG